jgi:hypothetical protein
MHLNIRMEMVFHTTSGALWSGPPSTYLNVVAVNMSMGSHWGKMTRHAACTLTEDLHRKTGSTTTQKTRAIYGFYGNEWFEILWLVEKPQKISPWGSSALNIVQHGWTIYLKPQSSHDSHVIDPSKVGAVSPSCCAYQTGQPFLVNTLW